jgi:hypothetical protein
MYHQRNRQPEDLTASHTSCRLTSCTSTRVVQEQEPTSPAGIAALAAHVLEVEIMVGPDMVGDVVNMEAMD